jgi:hypothetical protein
VQCARSYIIHEIVTKLVLKAEKFGDTSMEEVFPVANVLTYICTTGE